MLLIHAVSAALLAWATLGLTPTRWLLAMLLFYLGCRLLGLAVPRVRVYAMRVEAGARFVPWYAYRIVAASLDVAAAVLDWRSTVTPAVVRVSLQTDDKRLITLISCLLTLTPGTLALDYLDKVLYVHVLDSRSADSVQHAVDEIEQRLAGWIHPPGEFS
ncbi:Na+/H+ antiporter subunit E [Pseudomonas sp. OIL-1]|uniref:Na+/H+ antiporter subunit E n=1 Tax=Pseudomonas sp. OIL-1 TaxID=2706126 RepID=UPI0013A7B136|nr:Na+/H+ antiporter subunit E [Pseudomonas sp. OIL-1]QIB52844.1 Na+/H+ antiporter subunit E [Pseudomonas sp. OIL-1]